MGGIRRGMTSLGAGKDSLPRVGGLGRLELISRQGLAAPVAAPGISGWRSAPFGAEALSLGPQVRCAGKAEPGALLVLRLRLAAVHVWAVRPAGTRA